MYKFRKGDRVKLSEEAITHRIARWATAETGTVTGYTKIGCVKVLIDGNVTPQSYSQIFWEKIPDSKGE